MDSRLKCGPYNEESKNANASSLYSGGNSPLPTARRAALWGGARRGHGFWQKDGFLPGDTAGPQSFLLPVSWPGAAGGRAAARYARLRLEGRVERPGAGSRQGQAEPSRAAALRT